MLHVVAGVVLAQGGKAVPDLPVGQDDLDAEREFAHVAVAQHRHATGVGRKVAADLGRALGAQAQGEQPVGVLSRALDVGQDAAGLDRDRVVERIDLAHAIEPRQRQHNLLARFVGHRSTAQAGVATLGHDGRAYLRAQADDGGDLFGVGRPHDHARLPAIQAAFVQEVRSHLRGIGDRAFRPYRRANPLDEIVRGHLGHGAHATTPFVMAGIKPDGSVSGKVSSVRPRAAVGR